MDKFSKKFLTFMLLTLTILWPSLALANQPANNEILNEVIAQETIEVYTKGRILETKEIKEKAEGNFVIPKSVQAKVKITDGKFKGETLSIRHDFSGNPAFDFEINKNDKVVVLLNVKDNQIIQGNIANIARDSYLVYLTTIFLIVIVAIGKLKGLKAIITLVLTVFAVIEILLPSILKGYDPVWATILVSGGVTALTLLIVGGFNMKSLTAIIGTMGGIIMTGFIVSIVIKLARLSGLSSEESTMLLYIPQQTQFDFQGLLFAGIIIGALGAVMDVGMSISSAIWEIHQANPKLTRWELTKAGLNVGKDVMGTMANTLILAYTGGSLPLLLLITAYDDPVVKIINLDMIATEIVRALAGSIGLFLAIPLTALCGGYLVKRAHKKAELEKETV